jgi:NAD-dependent deacetylase
VNQGGAGDPGALSTPLQEALHSARRVVAFTGAGISKESGLSTFREAQTGLWARFRPEDLATPQAFARDPELVWNWYTWRREGVAAAEPNAAHLALVRLQQGLTGAGRSFTLVTQNVDGLHRRGGSTDLVELHGNILRTICSRDRTPVEAWDTTTGGVPPCPRCGAPLRPDVVWFGEMLPEGAMERAAESAASCDLMLVVGTSGRVYPAASMVPVALQAGATVVVVDPGPSGWSDPGVHHLQGEAGRIVPVVVDHILGHPRAGEPPPVS